MASCIIHHDGLFFEWSSVSDAPSSRVMKREEFEVYYRERHGYEGMKDLTSRLDRAVQNGSSMWESMSAQDVISCNRAGPDETELTLSEIIARYKSAP